MEAFVTNYMKPGIPVIIQMSPTELGGPTIPWSFESVSDRCDSASLMPTAYNKLDKNAGEESEEGDRPWAGMEWANQVPLRDFTSKMERFDKLQQEGKTIEKKNVIYGFDFPLSTECPNLLKNFYVPRYFSTCTFQRNIGHAKNQDGLPGPISDGRRFGWPSLMMGQPHSRSELHYDEAGLPFWMAVFRGKKFFRMLPVPDNKHLTSGVSDKRWPGTADDLEQIGSMLPEYMNEGPDSYNFNILPDELGASENDNLQPLGEPDFKKFPKLCEAVVHESIVEAGDVIFIPTGTPHAAMNLNATIAITSNLFSPEDDPASSKWVRDYCNDGKEHLFPTRICDELWSDEGIKTPWDKREARTYYQIAGFAGPSEWCAFMGKRVEEDKARKSAQSGDVYSEYQERQLAIIKRFCFDNASHEKSQARAAQQEL